ncbi:type I secretion protein [Sulfitobacter sp. SK012]|uniref:calcium-binding protein n=1 Tax=Sulfitobacter sp. SK012 TaxID=1389005 RepID=UPI000E0B8C9D|nr:calcium-binding protein [Sulfitobacter sp. SK012]AXI49028.1 type I secretion protein [Sulfitobacter sp. SK012]
MLWLAGLMGLMAVGSVAFVDTSADEEDDIAPVQGHPDDMLNPDVEASPQIEFGDPSDISTDEYETTREQISGSATDDTLTGNDDDQNIAGDAGDDLLFGNGGADHLHGDDGDDSLLGGSDDDYLDGDDGADTLWGGDANDTLFGHSGSDDLYGGAGDDYLHGSDGADTLSGGTGDDVLQGGLEDDVLTGGAGADSLFGGWGDDLINGVEAGSNDAENTDTDDGDFLNGGSGDDVLIAGKNDIVTAGNGEDTIVLGDWINQGDAAEILDFAQEDDSLVLVWDDSDSAAPQPNVSIGTDPAVPGQMQVMLNDVVVAQVNGTALNIDDIALLPLSTAAASGLLLGHGETPH